MPRRTKLLAGACGVVAVCSLVALSSHHPHTTHDTAPRRRTLERPFPDPSELWTFDDTPYAARGYALPSGTTSSERIVVCNNLAELVERLAKPGSGVESLPLPLPDGSLAEFHVQSTTEQVLDMELSSRHERIQTFHGVAHVQSGAVVEAEIDSNPFTGIHVQLFSNDWVGYMDPASTTEPNVFRVYFQSHTFGNEPDPETHPKWSCGARRGKSETPNRLLLGEQCNEEYVGDGYCDHVENSEACGYDGGDCCVRRPNLEYCDASQGSCECQQPVEPVQDPETGCIDTYVGDDVCDAVNNNEACGYDGGDCCGLFADRQEADCGASPEDCECKDPADREFATRTYRLALASSATYTAYHGNTTETALAAMVTAINRVNGVYKRSLAIRFQLINETDRLIEVGGDAIPNEIEAVYMLDGFIANRINADYDIGHAFTTGAGGFAPGHVCSANKHQGVTGTTTPKNDGFYIDFVSHEIGHQLSAAHTWSGVDGFCESGAASAETNFEPGSGTTIMGYAGTCDEDDVQTASDPYFHVVSLEQIKRFTRNPKTGGSCGTVGATVAAPVFDSPIANSKCSIPKRTPFRLHTTHQTLFPQSASSAQYFYNWEQIDSGQFTALEDHSADGALFRSQIPQSTPERWFPQLNEVVDGFPTSGSHENIKEQLPENERNLTFALVARKSFDEDDVGVSTDFGGYWAERVQVQVVDAGPVGLDLVTPSSENTTTFVQGEITGVEGLEGIVDEFVVKLSHDIGQTFDVELGTVAVGPGPTRFDLPLPTEVVDAAWFVDGKQIFVMVEASSTEGCTFYTVSGPLDVVVPGSGGDTDANGADNNTTVLIAIIVGGTLFVAVAIGVAVLVSVRSAKRKNELSMQPYVSEGESLEDKL